MKPDPQTTTNPQDLLTREEIEFLNGYMPDRIISIHGQQLKRLCQMALFYLDTLTEINNLLRWKSEAMQVMNDLDLQAIGKEMELTLGDNIAILSYIKSKKYMGQIHAECDCLTPEKCTEKCLAAHSDSKTPQGWQPIETAPRDGKNGRMNLCLVCSLPSGRMVVCDPGFISHRDWTTMDGKYHAPTHWQPLPSPPTKDNK